MVDQTTIALVALLVGIVGSTLGAFAYISGELRKATQVARHENDTLKDALNNRIDTVASAATASREALRSELLGTINRVEAEVRSMGERVVRRTDMEQLEVRLTRSYDRLDRKLDELGTAVSRLATQGGLRVPRDEGDNR